MRPYSMVFALVLVTGCAKLDFDPPAEPPHIQEKDGFLHALRWKQPFMCGPGEVGIPCLTTRPADRYLSCDAIGCHGGFGYTGDPLTTPRHLRGSEGPSCFACHGDKWNDKEDEEDEEDK